VAVGAAVAAAGSVAVVSVVAVSVAVASVEVALVVAEALVAASESTAAITPTAVVISATAGADTSARIIDTRSVGVTARSKQRARIRCVGQSDAPDFAFGQRQIKLAGALIRVRSRNWKLIDELDWPKSISPPRCCRGASDHAGDGEIGRLRLARTRFQRRWTGHSMVRVALTSAGAATPIGMANLSKY